MLSSMNRKPLSETNPYLRDPKAYERFLIVNVTRSTAIELGQVHSEIIQALKNKKVSSLVTVSSAEK